MKNLCPLFSSTLSFCNSINIFFFKYTLLRQRLELGIHDIFGVEGGLFFGGGSSKCFQWFCLALWMYNWSAKIFTQCIHFDEFRQTFMLLLLWHSTKLVHHFQHFSCVLMYVCLFYCKNTSHEIYPFNTLGWPKGVLRFKPECFKGCNAILLGFPGDWVVKNPPAKWEMWVQSLGHKDPLEKEMATHSSILAWRIPWTEEPAGLQSKRVGHDLATKQPPQYFIVNYKYYAVLQSPQTYSLCSTKTFYSFKHNASFCPPLLLAPGDHSILYFCKLGCFRYTSNEHHSTSVFLLLTYFT